MACTNGCCFVEQSVAFTVWKRGSQRAPHKPLLLLYALAKCSRSEPRLISYADVDRDLRDLLLQFGPERKSCHPEYPFWRLQNDGIWELKNAERAARRSSNTDAKKVELLKYGVRGGFTEDVFDLLDGNRPLITELAVEILLQHFPTSVLEDILQAVGLDIRFEVALRRKRDPAFREKVLTAYEYRCAVCGYDVRLGPQQLALEAAHIKWHQAGGPDTENNGLALCALHHKLFDRGAFSLIRDGVICVSRRAHGTSGFSEWLMAFHGHPIRFPQAEVLRPTVDFTTWHRRQVFRGPARDLLN
ncbi:MAG: phosphorothioated DNA-binding restriction endonuclease [Pirellulaceae bacterium]